MSREPEDALEVVRPTLNLTTLAEREAASPVMATKGETGGEEEVTPPARELEEPPVSPTMPKIEEGEAVGEEKL